MLKFQKCQTNLHAIYKLKMSLYKKITECDHMKQMPWSTVFCDIEAEKNATSLINMLAVQKIKTFPINICWQKSIYEQQQS